MELATEALRKQVAIAFQMHDIREARLFLDAAELGLPVSNAHITALRDETIRGHWFTCDCAETQLTLLFFHGGGYCFYPRSYTRFIGIITQAIGCRTFALDYRLTPEDRFPAQLEDALNAYRWLMGNGAKPAKLIIGGDSAGGNLALALLLALREKNLPQPAMVIALSPPTDFEAPQGGGAEEASADWLDWRELGQWADWFCDPSERRNPLVSQIRADLRGLAPIYIQSGSAEILYDSIQAFAECAKKQGANVVLESWKNMNHDFQVFAPLVPQSVEALGRLGEIVSERTRGTGS